MISVLVTHHKPDLEPYLARALESLEWQKSVLMHVMILSSCEVTPALQERYPKFTFLIDPQADTPTKKVDFWMESMPEGTTHTLLMSNDVILSDLALLHMSRVQGECIQSAMSNNENGHRFAANLPYPKNSYDLADVNPEKVRIHNPPVELLIRTPWVSFYAPFMPLSVWKKVGSLNVDYDKKYNDTDFCFRAAEAGIPTLINTSCYALHYGSKTTKDYMNRDEELIADQKFQEEWPVQRILPLLMF